MLWPRRSQPDDAEVREEATRRQLTDDLIKRVERRDLEQRRQLERVGVSPHTRELDAIRYGRRR